MRHDPRPCPRCGWRRTTHNGRQGDTCGSCRGANERIDVGQDVIEWRTVGMIKRGTVGRPSEQWDAQDASNRECPQIVKQQGAGQQQADDRGT